MGAYKNYCRVLTFVGAYKCMVQHESSNGGCNTGGSRPMAIATEFRLAGFWLNENHQIQQKDLNRITAGRLQIEHPTQMRIIRAMQVNC